MKRWFLGIFALALILRVVSLDKLPVGFTPDEASFGYDAFSILKTGNDQWGSKLPLLLKSFGDYKSPLYSYLDLPFVAGLGLTKTAVRLPNALLGALTIFPVWLLAGLIAELLKLNDRNKKILQISSSLLLAISSWHIMMSRGAFEANLTTFLLPMGFYLFLKSVKEKKGFAIASIVLGLNLFSYHSPKLVTPLLLLILILVYWKEIRKIEAKKIAISLVVFFTLFLVLVTTLFNGGFSRANDISVFSGALNQASDERHLAMNNGMNPVLAKLIHNKYQVSLFRFTNNYISYFSPDFLFIKGPAETTYGMLPGRGVLYIFELPLLVGFLFFITKNRSKPLAFLLVWLLLAPIPASLAQGAGFAANRDEISLPAFQIVLSLGLLQIFLVLEKLLEKRLLKIGLVIYGIFSAIVFLSFLKVYFYVSPFVASGGMLYGNLEVGEWLKDNIKSGDKIIVSRSLSEPHIYIAFANDWNPKNYQESTKNWDLEAKNVKWVDQLPEYSLGNYTFTSINFVKDKFSAKYIVAKINEFPENTNFVKVFTYPSDANNGIAVYSTEKVYAQKNL